MQSTTEQLGERLAAVHLKDATNGDGLTVAVHDRGVIESPMNGKPCWGYVGVIEAMTGSTLPEGVSCRVSFMFGSSTSYEAAMDDSIIAHRHQAQRATASELAWQLLDDLHSAAADPDEWWAMFVADGEALSRHDGRTRAAEVLALMDLAVTVQPLVEQHADAIRRRVHGEDA